MMHRCDLGPFALTEPLAEGGMGQVWRGVHVEQGVPVAVKVLTRPGLSSPELVRALEDEVRAVAGLDHPHVVWLYDQGTVGAEAARGSGLPPGAPWLAMELATGGTLTSRAPGLDLEQVCDVLLDLLAALSHAHARGVLHRDIKPANVLFGGARPGLKLTDFGMVYHLEHHVDGEGSEPQRGGTPSWMAPEQIRGEWSDQGPWTDLYSVGCLAWWLCCGRRPFSGGRAALFRHLSQAPPPLEPRFAVPAGFAGWVLRLLQKDPRARFGLAADAAAALEAVRGMDGAPAAPPAWRPREPSPPPVALAGAGLGLFGLRAVPLVGRERERDALWAALAAVHATGSARAVVLRGHAGSGKSRLARWLCRRALELGAAEPLRVTHDLSGGPRDGVPGLMVRALRALGASDAELLQRAGAVLERLDLSDPHEAAALAAIARPGLGGRRASESERTRTVERWLAARARLRPVVLWVDDVHLGPDALRMVGAWLERGALGRVLVVCTAQEEALAERTRENALLEALCARDDVRLLPLGPLSQARRAELVQAMLAVAPPLADRLARRTLGNPLFAVHLLSDLVSRGALAPGPSGFRLREGVEAELPATVQDMWWRRVERVLDGHPDWRPALELAAALGATFELREWHDACAAGGWEAPADLLDALRLERLAGPDGPGWAFAHGMLRESVVGASRAAGRFADLHRACAEMLRGTPDTAQERLGRHLLEAGAAEEALEPLLAGARTCIDSGDLVGGADALAAWVRAADASRLDRAEPRWLRGALVHELLLRTRGELDSADRWRAQVRARTEHMPAALRFQLELAAANGARARGGLDAFEQHARVALATAQQSGDPDLVASGRFLVGVASMNRARLAEARSHLYSSVARFEAEEQLHEAFDGWLQLGIVEIQAGDLERAEQCARRGLVLARRAHARRGVAEAELTLGEVAKMRGDLDEAERFFASCQARLEAIGHFNANLARLNLGLLLVDRGAIERARAELQALLAAELQPYLAMGVHLGMMVCTARQPDDAFEGHLEAVRDWLARGWVDSDLARLAERAAREAGPGPRARAALEVALDQFTRLGRPEDAARIREALDA